MKHRFFVGILIAEKLQEEITRWQKAYRHLPVRWILPQDIHITLIPPWYEPDVDRVKGKLAPIAGKFSPFPVEFHHITFGPHPKRPHLIWAEGPYNRRLVDLKDALEHMLRQPAEQRSFCPHLTLARFRAPTFSSFPVKNLHEKVSWKEEATCFSLIESRLTPTGAEYHIVQEYRFSSTAPRR